MLMLLVGQNFLHVNVNDVFKVVLVGHYACGTMLV